MQRKKMRPGVGNSMNSTKYNTISNNDTPSLTLPNVNRSQKDINPLDDDFRSGNDRIIKNMQGSQSRMSKAIDGIVNVLSESPDYSSLNKINKSPLAMNTLEH